MGSEMCIRDRYNALIYIADRILNVIDWFFNLVRPYLPYAIMISVSWFMTTRALENPEYPLWKKIVYPIVGIILGIALGEIYDRLVPERIMIPKISTEVKPIVTETPISTITLFGIYGETPIVTKTLYSTFAESPISSITLYGTYTPAESPISTKTLYSLSTGEVPTEVPTSTRTLYATA